MKSSNNPAMKTVACLLFSLLILLQSQDAQSDAGTCGPAAGKNYITSPEGRLTAELCATGTVQTRKDDDDHWRWQCSGQNCSAYKARCGDQNGDDLTSDPTLSGRCDPDGIDVNFTYIDSSSSWTWDCKDSENALVHCRANYKVDGSCGTAEDHDYVNPPALNLCDTGTATAVTNDGNDHWRWSCEGAGNGGTDDCRRADIVNCGTAQGSVSQYHQPYSNLCSEGTDFNMTNSGSTWTWKCRDFMGDEASCWAYTNNSGDCGTAHEQTYDTAPTTGLCVAGTSSDMTDSGLKWTWKCTNGATVYDCWAYDRDNGVCGAAYGTASENAPPESSLCSSGIASAVADAGATWTWACSGINGGSNVNNCSAPHVTDGNCGSANGGTYENAPPPAGLLCATGVPSGVTANGQYWNWNCAGANGGTGTSCSANKTTTNTYCAAPPFIVSPVEPNVMSVIDASGSMSWNAYDYGSNPLYKVTEEGYFRPDKNYKRDSTGVYWEETVTGAVACPTSYPSSTTTTNIYKGSCLNFLGMTRMDLVRWAMTGGRPASCSRNEFNADQCDPELWQEAGNDKKVGAACNDEIGGCILQTTKGYKVKVPWSRVWDGLAFQFKAMTLKPRMGAMFYSDSTVRSEGQVYLGDFTAPNSTKSAFPYLNLITAINSTAPSGGTPTGPAMWDAFNYFKQSAPQYHGLAVQSGPNSSDFWRNPMYVCDGGGANCVEISCAKNFVLLMSDGQWNWPSCSIDNSASDPVKPAYQMHQNFTNLATNKTTNVNATYAIGIFLGGTGEQSLKNVAMYGSFNKTSGWPDSLGDYPLGYCDMEDCGNTGRGSGCTALPASTSDWDNAAPMGVPDTFHSASDAAEIKNAIKNAILDMLRRSSSGTAVSVLSSSEGSGANLMQALFYPKRTFAGGAEVSWTSDLMNYWYYMDPFFTSSTIREDTKREGAAATPPYTLLDLQQDYITRFAYDPTQEKTLASRWQDTTGKGTPLTDKGSVAIEDTASIWRAGFNLWWTDPTDRIIKTSLDGSTLIPFTTANSSTLGPYLGDTTNANAIINYTRGYDCVDALGAPGDCPTLEIPTVYTNTIGRSRTVGSGVCSTRKSPCSSAADCPSGETCSQETHVWKLGDIISSTPRIMGPGYLNNYNIKSPYGYNDTTYNNFIKSNDYTNRQLVFVGANDGMFHAFKLGKLLQKWTGKQWYEAAKQEGSTGVGGIGSEAYAFIPQNVLPYLQYLHDKDYCHVYMVDGPTTLTDVSIHKPSTCTLPNYWDCPKVTTMQAAPLNNAIDYDQTSWRTVVIGSMGIGGATCDAATSDTDRISTPVSVSGNPVGWSSYFALDVTDQADPKLLWEFSNADLGVTNVGSAVVRVSNKQCAISNNPCTTDIDCGDIPTNGHCVNTDTNGRWFAILPSGSTGPIVNNEFKGTSDKSLKLFVLDLQTGELLRTIDTGITNAFAGSLSTSALDLEKDQPSNSGNYQDDAVYIGYVQNTTNGGVLRLVINDDIDPAHWTASKVIDNIGPITTSVVNLLDRDNNKLWLYFGEGRYFYKEDDLATQRMLYGVQEPCFDATDNTISPSCSDVLTLASLKDQTTTPSATLADTEKGWYIKMNAAATSIGAERIVSNPTPDALGAVYFLSFAPVDDVCSFGGTSYFWAVDYKTGGQVTYEMKGKSLVQVSTGEIKELNLADAFTQNDGRKSDGFMGIPPTGQGVMILKSPEPIKKFMHVQEQ